MPRFPARAKKKIKFVLVSLAVATENNFAPFSENEGDNEH